MIRIFPGLPVILGCEKLNGQEVYLSAGYHLEDEFYAAHVEIDSQNTPEAPFRLYSPFKGMARALDLQCITELELLRVELTKKRRIHQKLSFPRINGSFTV